MKISSLLLRGRCCACNNDRLVIQWPANVTRAASLTFGVMVALCGDCLRDLLAAHVRLAMEALVRQARARVDLAAFVSVHHLALVEALPPDHAATLDQLATHAQPAPAEDVPDAAAWERPRQLVELLAALPSFELVEVLCQRLANAGAAERSAELRAALRGVR